MHRHKHRIRKYVKNHSSRGHSFESIRNVLVKHGYDKKFVNNQIKSCRLDLGFKGALFLLLFVAIFAVHFIPLIDNEHADNLEVGLEQITGDAIAPGEGCCEILCKETTADLCQEGTFHLGEECDDVVSCELGCCLDDEGYCLTNYIKGNCEKQDFIFVKRSCDEIHDCLPIINPGSIRGFTGRTARFDLSVINGFALVDPVAIQHGSVVNLGYFIYNDAGVTEVRARIKLDEVVLASIVLYDDGGHNDRNPYDSFYANNWDSEGIDPPLDRFTNYQVDIVIMQGEEETLKVNETYITIVDNTMCLPIVQPWNYPLSRNNIVFAANNFPDMALFENEVKQSIRDITSIAPFDGFRDNFNFHRIDLNYNLNNIQLLNQVMSQCPFFDRQKDIVVVIDDSVQVCSSGQGLAKVIPDTFYYNPNPLNSDDLNFGSPEEAFDNFCLYTYTAYQFTQVQLLGTIPPNVELLTDNEKVFDNFNVSFDFILSDNWDDEINYSIFAYPSKSPVEIVEMAVIAGVDLTVDQLLALSQNNYNNLMQFIGLSSIPYVVEGIAAHGDLVNKEISYMEKENYSVWVQAEDSHGNLAGSDWITVYVLEPEQYELRTTILYPSNNSILDTLTTELNFTVNYIPDEEVNYSVFLDGLLVGEGEAEANNVTSVVLTLLAEKDYNITVVGSYNDFAFNSTINISVDLTPGFSSPPRISPVAGYEDVLMSILVIVLTFLIATAMILHQRGRS